MKRLIVYLLIALLAFSALPFANTGYVAAQGDGDGDDDSSGSGLCGDITTVTLLAGQTIEAGTVSVWNDADNLYIQYDTTGGWFLTEVQAHVATSPEDIPQNAGGFIPGQFHYKAEGLSTVDTYQFVIPLTGTDPDGNDYDWTAEGTELFIAAHAVVVTLDDGRGNGAQEETAWGDGEDPGGSNWSTYFTHTVQPCEEPPEEPGDSTGCTPGYWKNHEDAWEETGYSPEDDVSSVFTTSLDATLMDALNFGGGRGVEGAERILLRAAVAALLNASHPEVGYTLSTGAVIEQVDAALASGDRQTMLELAEELDDYNNGQCDLGGPNSTGNGHPNNDDNDNGNNGNNGKPPEHAQNDEQGPPDHAGEPGPPPHAQNDDQGPPDHSNAGGNGKGHNK